MTTVNRTVRTAPGEEKSTEDLGVTGLAGTQPLHHPLRRDGSWPSTARCRTARTSGEDQEVLQGHGCGVRGAGVVGRPGDEEHHQAEAEREDRGVDEQRAVAGELGVSARASEVVRVAVVMTGGPFLVGLGVRTGDAVEDALEAGGAGGEVVEGDAPAGGPVEEPVCVLLQPGGLDVQPVAVAADEGPGKLGELGKALLRCRAGSR